MAASTSSTHYRACNLCEAMCGIQIQTKPDGNLHIRGDAQDSFSRGYMCMKAEALEDVHNDSHRVKKPLRRRGESWEEISWKEAFDDFEKNVTALQKQHGYDSVATYAGNPNVHNYGSTLFLSPFVRSLKTRNRFTATSVDQLPHHLVAYFMFGHQFLLPIPDIDHTEYMLILGANPLVSRGSLMTAPDITTRLTAIRQRGGKVVLLDPRRTETASFVDQHYFVRPGTDCLFMLAVLQVIFSEGLANPGRLIDFTDGFTELKDAVKTFTPESVAQVTGIEAGEVRTIAREFALAKTAVCYGRIGVSTQEFGTLTHWLINALNIVTGNLDRRGGAMFTTPAFDPVPYLPKGSFARRFSRVHRLPESGGEFPVSILAEEILTEGKGQIKALITIAGNPALSTPNGKRLEEALGILDYMVAIDFYLNETTRFANLILPPTAALEHENYDVAFHVLAVRNTAKFSPALFLPAAGAKHDWQILSNLTRRMLRHEKSLTKRVVSTLASYVSPEKILALALRFGPYGSRLNLFKKGLTLNKLKRHPHGLDLGPMQPRLPERLYKKNKRINLAPEECLKAVRLAREKFFEMPTVDAPTSVYDLQLIGRRQVRTNNSWMGHIGRLVKGKSTCLALIHSEDAAKRKIVSGSWVLVTSRVGSVRIQAAVVDTIMPGVISIPHGFGHNRAGTKLSVPDHAVGVSINDITDSECRDTVSGNAAFNGIPVKVELA